MKKIFIIISSLLLATTCALQANIALYRLLDNQSISYIIIIGGFLLYSVCLCIASRAKNINTVICAFIVAFIANFFSALIGIITLILLAFISLNKLASHQESWIHSFFYSRLPHLLGAYGEHLVLGQLTLNNILMLIAYWILIAILNTLITVWILIITYPKIPKYRILIGTLIANLISTGFGIFLLGLYKYLYGSFSF